MGKNQSMTESFNVLITSISKKVPLISSVKEALNRLRIRGVVYGGDSSEECVGKYFVDKFWQMPKLEDLKINELLNYCLENQIKAIFPTRDLELTYFAKHHDFLIHHGIYVMISPENRIKTCLDKFEFSKFLSRHHLKTPLTTTNPDEIKSEFYVVKERFGSGSKNMGIKLKKDEAIQKATLLKEPIFQEYIEGLEYTVDIYLNMQSEIVGTIERKRLYVSCGESQITETLRNPLLKDLTETLAKLLKLIGHINIQVIQDKKTDEFFIIECNPRFGGASTLSLKAGLDSFIWFLLEIQNKKCPPFKRIQHEIKMVRYAEDKSINL